MKISKEKEEKILSAFKKTGTIRGTKRITGVNRKTIRRVMDRMANPIPAAVQTTPRPSVLDPYKPKIGYLVKEKNLSAVRVLEEIRELGYGGGYTILKDLVRIIRPPHIKIPRPPIDHPPGEEGQMDWSPHKVIIGGRLQVVQTGSFVLCFSRWIYFRHFTDQTLESVIKLHKGAFKELEATPEIITYDNMTTVGRHVGPGTVWINPKFQRFADEYGFKIVILQPGKKERHGKVERPFHYIENNFLAGREFADLSDLNEQADQWRWNKANVRIHGTLKQRPVDRLERERPFLNPLSPHLAVGYYKEVERKINVDFCVVLDLKHYSVDPGLIGKIAKVRLFAGHLEIWVDGKLSCKHPYGDKERNILPEHQALYHKMTGQKRLLEDAFMCLGEPATIFYEGLKKTRKGAAGYHLQRILQYAQRHGADVVAGALSYAAKYQAFSAESVLRIITGKKLKQEKRPEPKIPENTRQYLRAYAVEKQNPAHYDQLLKEENNEPDTNGNPAKRS